MTVDRIFLDANILFSVAYGSPGLNGLWKLAKEKHCLLFASNYVIEEARRNLLNSEHMKKLENCLSEVHVVAELDPGIPCPIELPDKGRPVMMSAISVKANYLLTGDTIHFGKYFGRVVRGMRICRPRDYLSRPHLKAKSK